MDYAAITVDVDGPVATVTLNRPEHRNGMTGEMVAETYDAVQALSQRLDVRVVVFTGAGDRYFCPGADLDVSAGGADIPESAMPDPRAMHVGVLLHEMRQVTVAAINGACAGAGLGWAAGCDLRVASSNAVFNTAFLDVGVAGDMGLPWMLPRLVGAAKARELFFLAEKFDAATAKELGLVTAVFEPAEFRAGVQAIVDRLAGAPAKALLAMKANFTAAERLSYGDFVDLETARHLHLITGPDFREGVAAFLARHGRPRSD